jgi:hypothetical protein
MKKTKNQTPYFMKNKQSKMIKGLLVIIAASTMLLAGFACTKQQIDTFTTVGFNYSYEVSIKDTTIIGSEQSTTVDYISPEINTKWTETIKDAKTTADLVSEIKMTRLSVTCLSGTSNLDYVNTIKIYIKSAKNAELLLMEKANIPAGAFEVNMDLKDVNLKNYIFEEKIQFRTAMTFKPTVAIDDQQLRMDASLVGKAKLTK